jgi:hypothetical protein
MTLGTRISSPNYAFINSPLFSLEMIKSTFAIKSPTTFLLAMSYTNGEWTPYFIPTSLMRRPSKSSMISMLAPMVTISQEWSPPIKSSEPVIFGLHSFTTTSLPSNISLIFKYTQPKLEWHLLPPSNHHGLTLLQMGHRFHGV